MMRWALYLLGLILTTALIWYWNRGAQRRRFRKAFPRPNPLWTEDEAPFLRSFERAFRLPHHWANHLSPELTPMEVYLTLYPEHCIYDASELTRLAAALNGTKRPDNFLSLSLRTLASLPRA